jgi:hypothetical protein
MNRGYQELDKREDLQERLKEVLHFEELLCHLEDTEIHYSIKIKKDDENIDYILENERNEIFKENKKNTFS